MKSLLFIISLVISSWSFAQNHAAIYLESGTKKWGFISENGTVLIEPQYREVLPFGKEGLTFVMTFKKEWKVIDKSNNELSLPYDNWLPKSYMGFGKKAFVDGLATILVGKKEAVVNAAGKEVFGPSYDKISNFHSGVATGIIGDTYYFLKADGKRTKIDSQVSFLGEIKDGFAPYRNLEKQFGFVNEQGEVVIDAQFKKVGYFYDGIAWARRMDGKIGFINKEGNWVIEPEYDAVSDFDNVVKIATVRIGENWFFINKKGEKISVNGATKLGQFVDGIAWVRLGESHGYVDASGKLITETTYQAAKPHLGGLGYVKKNGMWGMVNTSGKLVVECKYMKIGKFSEGLTPVLEGDFWGFVNGNGEVVIQPQFVAIREFKNGFAAATKDRINWGFIDRNGNWVVEPSLSKVKDMEKIP